MLWSLLNLLDAALWRLGWHEQGGLREYAARKVSRAAGMALTK